ncbi:hypothetical protein [Lacipirellula sp.]|uniref:hypothetical protein n=1 Tax=Lacipirellula sp. TaxID=2691419 RepID=UPI003D0B4FC7
MADDPIHPMGIAMLWVGRIFAAALMMVLPGVAGFWLDKRFGMGFIGLIGFGFGLVGGMIYLISATRATEVGRSEAARPKAGQDPPQAP